MVSVAQLLPQTGRTSSPSAAKFPSKLFKILRFEESYLMCNEPIVSSLHSSDWVLWNNRATPFILVLSPIAARLLTPTQYLINY